MDVRLCFFGDSFTAGVGDAESLGWVGRLVARSQTQARTVTGYNLGIRRETTLDVAGRFVREAEARLRDADWYGVVFATGVNDTTMEGVAQRLAPQQSIDALSGVLGECAARSWAALVVGPVPIADRVQNERIEALSLLMAQLCEAHAVPYVGLAPELSNDGSWLAETASSDGAHPSADGYKRLTSMLWPTFESWLPGDGARIRG